MPNISELHSKVKKPGIYFDMPNEEYHEDASLSNSRMSKLSFTPKFGRTIETPRDFWFSSPFNPQKEPFDTESFKYGRAVHTYILEPHKFSQDFKIMPKTKTTIKQGYIGEGQLKYIKSSFKELKEDHKIYSLFRGGFPEVSIFWIDIETGVPCRARMDYLSLKYALDYKSITSVYDIGYHVVDFAYYRQAAFYMDGLNEIIRLLNHEPDKITIKDCPGDQWLEAFKQMFYETFVFVFQAKVAPYIARAEEFDQEIIAIGRERYREALRIFKENYEMHGSNKWPSGYEGGVGLTTIDELPPKIQY